MHKLQREKLHKIILTLSMCNALQFILFFCFHFLKNTGCDPLKNPDARFEKTPVHTDQVIEPKHKTYVYYTIKTLKIRRGRLEIFDQE